MCKVILNVSEWRLAQGKVIAKVAVRDCTKLWDGYNTDFYKKHDISMTSTISDSIDAKSDY